jgi:hypothetical protein
MDPTKFWIYKKFEANLTKGTTDNPCSDQSTPSNNKGYTNYENTVTHGFPGVLTVTLDLYGPASMPDHSCCIVPLIASLNCVGIPGKPTSLSIYGTGPYCCPNGATEGAPCASSAAGPSGSPKATNKTACTEGSTTPCASFVGDTIQQSFGNDESSVETNQTTPLPTTTSDGLGTSDSTYDYYEYGYDYEYASLAAVSQHVTWEVDAEGVNRVSN